MDRALANNTDSRFGLVIDRRFHRADGWVSALTGYLVEAMIQAFRPVIISSQFDYWRHKRRLRYIISLEPGWAAPRIRYDARYEALKAVFYSDPHYRTKERFDYFRRNGFDYVFSYYRLPFFRHFDGFPEEKFVHMPWALPEQYVRQGELVPRTNEVAIFGGQQGDAYDVRNWCRQQTGVTCFDYSGVENKQLSDAEYFSWLATLDAAIAAGSSQKTYDLVTPKYFEIAAAGALLLGQSCGDLAALGFNDSNMIVFEQSDFNEKLSRYRDNYQDYRMTREAGRDLILDQHLISHRIKRIQEKFELNESTY